jgi:hypothetical protein
MKLIFAFEAISGRAALSLILATHRRIGEIIAFFSVTSHDNKNKATNMERACETRSAIFRTVGRSAGCTVGINARCGWRMHPLVCGYDESIILALKQVKKRLGHHFRVQGYGLRLRGWLRIWLFQPRFAAP